MTNRIMDRRVEEGMRVGEKYHACIDISSLTPHPGSDGKASQLVRWMKIIGTESHILID